MIQYQVKDLDGVVHHIEAVTHVLDSNGLTLYSSVGVVVAIFPKFAWMRQTQAVIAQPEEQAKAVSGSDEVAAPAATGE